MQEKLILVTNDDGVDAPGIKFLTQIAKQFGRVIVLGPDSGRSGQSHAVTMNTPLRLNEIEKSDNFEIFSSNGTPVDCVKLALHYLLEKKPDLILSGINHGANASVNIFYSGTMAAVIEGCMLNIPAVGFSTCEDDYSYDLSPLRTDIETVISKVLNDGLGYRTCLNVNFPKNYNPEKGMIVCRQGHAYWEEEFEERIDTQNRKYYWLKGKFNPLELSEDTDIWAIKHGYASVVPVSPDLTSHDSISNLKLIFSDDQKILSAR